ncbi:helix-turn-helix transcriptional regulator [Thiothrix winogradskyi]|uniref:helix-turn-helix transcriptional regulator n=1 Tax=Thiothrix winogradskyi TaxID=96472 RepID=UPI0039C97CBF
MQDRNVRKPEMLKIAGVCYGTVTKWEKAGRFPKRTGNGGRAVWWKESELLKWQQDPKGWEPPK